MNSSLLKTYVWLIGSAVLCSVLVRVFLFDIYQIPSKAMRPTLDPGDLVIGSKFGLHSSSLRRGDVIIFNFDDEPDRDYIKRIVGIEGDHIQFTGGSLILNGQTLSQKVEIEPFNKLLLKNPLFNKSIRSEVIKEALKENCRTEKLPSKEYSICSTSESSAFETKEEWIVPEGMVFVAGDFRSEILDLKRIKPYGLVPFSNINAKALYIALSLDKPESSRSSLGRINKDRVLRRIN